MNNLELYNKVRAVPEEAMKSIVGGRLKGFTDINPMWRIKTLTEIFGKVGDGWYTEIVRFIKDEGANGEISIQMEIRLFYKLESGQWSQPIVGIGGSMLVTKESNGLRTDDEAYKKAYTDALSVACKAIGIGADVYFSKDKTKYDTLDEAPKQTPKQTNNRTQQQPQTNNDLLDKAINEVDNCAFDLKILHQIWNKYPELHVSETFKKMVTAKKKITEEQEKQQAQQQ